jgi:hypothetical protein
MKEIGKPERPTVSIVIRDHFGRLVRTDVLLGGSTSGDIDSRWYRWAADTLRAEIVDALAKGYQPTLPLYLAPVVTERLLRDRQERLRLADGPAVDTALEPDRLQFARFIVENRLESWVKHSSVAWELASLILIWSTVHHCQLYERRMGKGAVEQLHRAGSFNRLRLGSISSDAFAKVVGPSFRDYWVPTVASHVAHRVRNSGAGVNPLEIYLGLRPDDTPFDPLRATQWTSGLQITTGRPT